MRVQAEDHVIPVIQMLMYILKLTGEYMGHRILHRRRDIDDRLVVCRRLPHIQYGIADLNRIINLCPRKALRAVLEGEVPVRLSRQLKQKLRPFNGNLLDLFLTLSEHLLSLRNRRRIIQMYHRMRRPLDRLEGLLDNMLSRLCQYLDRHIRRDHILLDQRPHKLVFGLRRGRKTNLDLLEADIHKHLEELKLLL